MRSFWHETRSMGTGLDSKSAQGAISRRVLLPAAILLVADLLQPILVLAVDGLPDGEVCHGGGGRRAVPVLNAWRKPDHVAGPDLLLQAAPLLHEAEARRDDEGLSDGMRVPSRAGARLEGDVPARHPRRSGRGEHGIDPHRACEVVRRAFGGGLRAGAGDPQGLTIAGRRLRLGDARRRGREQGQRREGRGKTFHILSFRSWRAILRAAPGLSRRSKLVLSRLLARPPAPSPSRTAGSASCRPAGATSPSSRSRSCT